MNLQVKRSCGHSETHSFHGSDAAWKVQEAHMKATVCAACHRERIKERVKAGSGVIQ